MASELAGRWSRLGAVLIDTVILVAIPGILMAVVVPALASSSQEGSDPSTLKIGVISVWILYALVIFIIQSLKLHKRGQTIGKQLVGIKIVLIDGDRNGGFVPNVLLRVVVPAVISAVPIAGAIFSLVDALFIFREDKRCIHDLIAGTRVVQA